jgi:hypothetical protein
MYKRVVALTLVSLCSGMLQAVPRPAVIELFTSQGCSSCPPADALLAELAARPDVIALAFHVDYWDGLGWRDRFALPLSAQRQQRYASALHLASVFTPQVIIDGQQSAVGSNRSALLNAIQKPRNGVQVNASVVSGELRVQLAATETHPPYQLLVVTYLPTASTPIGRGENAGRTLQEVNIVHALQVIADWDGRANQFTMPLSKLPTDATRAAVLVQQPQGLIVGAAVVALR